MRSVEMTGKTREEAIGAALTKLGVERHDANVEILDEGSKGFLGLGRRDVKVRVTIEGGGGGTDSREQDAAALLEEIIHRMKIEASVTAQPGEEDGIQLNVQSPDSAILIGRRGRTLEALQYLINRMTPAPEGAEESERVLVDIEGYIDRRQSSIKEMAQRLAQRVKETGRRVRLKPLSSQERRIIHVTLQDDPDVQTFSVGSPAARSVIIAPKGSVAPEEVEQASRPPRRPPSADDKRGPRRGPAQNDRRPPRRRGPESGGRPQQGRGGQQEGRTAGRSGERPGGEKASAGKPGGQGRAERGPGGGDRPKRPRGRGRRPDGPRRQGPPRGTAPTPANEGDAAPRDDQET